MTARIEAAPDPDVTAGVQNIYKAVYSSGLPRQTLELVHLRASQINGCSACVNAGVSNAGQGGVSTEKLLTVAAWYENPLFDDAERAALALTEAATRLADRPGAVTDETFRPEEKFGKVRIERSEAQLLYKDGENYVVMDNTTYDQITLSPEQLGSGVDYLKENDNLFLLRFDDRVLGVDLPTSVVLEVTESEPGFKGDTANASFKPAVVETGLAVDVPLFVNQGDLIRVDTRTGRYVERA